jgi:glutathionylspermidine synthase
MLRKQIAPRPNWRQRVADEGLIWHSVGLEPYWNEGTYYSFTLAEIERIEEATANLYELFLRAGDAMLNYRDGYWLRQMGIPDFVHGAIRDSWNKEPPALNYGRFDFGFDGTDLKLFEFNCDTPTSLLEAAVIQWSWKEEVFPDLDQYNSIHEKLVAKWKDLRPYLFGKNLHFMHVFDDAGEDTVTVGYLRDTASAAGLESKVLLVDDLGLDPDGRFIDMDDELIEAIYKLYPWEWIVHESYGPRIIEQLPSMLWIEPIWKMMWSNKGILPLLKTLDPTNEFLLDASFVEPNSGSYVKKPLLAREGANIEIINGEGIDHVLARTHGEYGEEGFVYQERYKLPETAPGVYPVIGAWIVDGEPCGMGIREDGLITGNTAKFVPHVIEG